MFTQKFMDGIKGDLKRLILRVAVNTGGNEWKRNGSAMMAHCEGQRIEVAITQQPGFVRAAAVPDGTNRMDDVFGRKLITARDDCFSRFAAADSITFRLQRRRAGCGENSAAHAAAHLQGSICRIYHGVNRYFGDIIINDL